VQVTSNGPMRQEPPLSDLLVGQTGGGERRDLELLARATALERVECGAPKPPCADPSFQGLLSTCG
jgi:hypothetical protein